jgi:hypothetical protein
MTMLDCISYLLKVSVSLTVFYFLYAVLFSRLTFFQVNRFCLLLGVVFSFVVPACDFEFTGVDTSAIITRAVGESYRIWEDGVYTSNYVATGSMLNDFSAVVILVYLVGSFLMLISVVKSCYNILKIKNTGVRSMSGHYVVVRSGLISPFSFFNIIFLPDCAVSDLVLEHEKAHVSQYHWIDLLLMEVATIVLWFNPLIYFYKHSIKIQHEYLADAYVTRRNPVAAYLMCMLEQLKYESVRSFVSQFNNQSIKKRITMMTKNKTANRFSWLYLLMAPTICLLLFAFAFRAPVKNNVINTSISIATEKPSVAPVSPDKVESISAFGLRKHPLNGKILPHTGMDFAAAEGVPVFAGAAGTVTKAGYDEGYGNYIIVKHDEIYTTQYFHLHENSVKTGDQVAAGQVIGTVGSTGISVGPHLHYEVLQNGKAVDPKDYLPSR